MNVFADAGAAVTVALLGAGYVWEKRKNGGVRSQIEGESRILIARSQHDYLYKDNVDWLDRLSQFRRATRDKHEKGEVEFSFRIEKAKNREVRFFFKAPEDRTEQIRSTLPLTVEWHDYETDDRVQAAKGPGSTLYIGLQDELLPIQRDRKSDVMLTIVNAMAPDTAVEIMFSPADYKQVARKLQFRYNRLNRDPNQRPSGFLGQVGMEFSQLGNEIVADLGGTLMGSGGGAHHRHQDPRMRQMQTYRQQQFFRKMNFKPLTPLEKSQLAALQKRFEEIGQMFEVKIKFEAGDTIKTPNNAFQAVLGALKNLQEPTNTFDKVPRPKKFYLSSNELTHLVHLPSTKEFTTMPVIREHARTLEEHEFAEGVAVGYLQHPVQKERLIKVPFGQFVRHFLLSGMTGAGKSVTLTFLMQSLIDSWIEDHKNGKIGRGFTFIDPAEESALVLLSRLQASLAPDDPLWKKIHFLSFSNNDYPVGMNILKVMSPEGILSLLTGQYGGGARMDRLIQNAVETLMMDHKVEHVLAGISPLLKNEEFREDVIQGMENEILKMYWEKDFPNIAKNPDAFQPVENRLTPFVAGATKLYFGQPDYALPIRQFMDDGHIFVVDVKALGERLMPLMIGGMIERYHTIAQQRPPSTSMTHFLLVDECHRVQTPAMMSIIKEDRKFGLSLGLITQSVEQFNADLKREIMDNLGTIISLRQGLKGSATTAELSHGHFSKDMLQGLDDDVAAVYTRVGGKEQSIETKAPKAEIYKGFYPNAEIVNFFDQRAVESRFNDLRDYAYDLQKEIGRPAQKVNDALNYYLKNGKWPNNPYANDDDADDPFVSSSASATDDDSSNGGPSDTTTNHQKRNPLR